MANQNDRNETSLDIIPESFQERPATTRPRSRAGTDFSSLVTPALPDLQRFAPSSDAGAQPPTPATGEGVSAQEPMPGDPGFMGPPQPFDPREQLRAVNDILLQEYDQDFIVREAVPSLGKLDAKTGIQFPTLTPAVGPNTGLPGIDVSGMRMKLRNAYQNRKISDFKIANQRQPTLEERKQIQDEADSKASRTLFRMQKKARGLKGPMQQPLPFYDQKDARVDIVDWMKGEDFIDDSYASAFLNLLPDATRGLVAPVVAGFSSGKMDIQDAATGEETKYNEGDSILGSVGWFFRAMAPTTYTATAARAGGAGRPEETKGRDRGFYDAFNGLFGFRGLFDADYAEEEGTAGLAAILDVASIIRGWGSEEQLKMLASGEDMFTLGDELGTDQLMIMSPLGIAAEGIEAAAVGMGYEQEGLGDYINQGLGSFLVSMVEPDIFLLAGGPIGKGGKAAGKVGVSLLKAMGKASGQKMARIASKLDDLAVPLEKAILSGDAEEIARTSQQVSDAIRTDDTIPRELRDSLMLRLAHSVKETGALPSAVKDNLFLAGKAAEELGTVDGAAIFRALDPKLAEELTAKIADGIAAYKAAGKKASGKIPEKLKDVLKGNAKQIKEALKKASPEDLTLDALRSIRAKELAKKKPRKNVDKLLGKLISQEEKALASKYEPLLSAADKATGAKKAGAVAGKAAKNPEDVMKTLSAAKKLTANKAAKTLAAGLALQTIQKNKKAILRLVGKAPRRIVKPSDVEAKAITTEFNDSLKNLLETRLNLLNAKPDAVEDAQKAVVQAQGRFDVASTKAAELGDAVLRREIDLAEEAAKANFKAQQEDLAETLALLKEVGKELNLSDEVASFDLSTLKSGLSPKKTLSKILEQLGQQEGAKGINNVLKAYSDLDRGVKTATGLAVSLQRMSSQLTKIANTVDESGSLIKALDMRAAAKGIEGVGEAQEMFATAANRAMQMNRPLSIKKYMLRAEQLMTTVRDPAIQLTGLTNKKINTALVRVMGINKLGTNSIVKAAEAARKGDDELVELATSVTRILDNAGPEATTAESIYRAQFSGSSAMAAAMPILKQLVKDKTQGVPPQIEAIAMMWVPSTVTGVRRAGTSKSLVSGAAKLISEADETYTFARLADDMNKLTVKEFSESTLRETGRAQVFASTAIIDAAGLAKSQAFIRQAVSDKYGNEIFEAAGKILKGDPADNIANYNEGLDLIAELGANVGLSRGKKADKLDLGWMRLDSDAMTSPIIPRAFMNATAEQIQAQVKVIQPYTKGFNNAQDTILSVGRAALRTYNAALLSGVLLPNPGYFVNITTGNFFQLWYEEGLPTALRFGTSATVDLAKSGLSLLKLDGVAPPWIARRVDEAYEAMVRRGAEDAALPSMTTGLAHPVATMILDPLKGPASKVIKGANGEITIGELRKILGEKGIFASFAQQSGLTEALRRGASKPMIDFIDNYMGGRAFAQFADAIEQRQRVLLFTDLMLRKGYTPDEAANAVLRSFYDWDYPMTKLESKWIRSWFMFWGFQRKAMSQAIEGMTDAIREAPSGTQDYITRGVFGSAGSYLTGTKPGRFARLKEINSSMQALKHVFNAPQIRDFNEDGVIDESDYNLLQLNKVSPWYLSEATGPRTALGTAVMTPLEANGYLGRYGIEATHYNYTMPSATPLEMTNLLLGMSKGLFDMAAGGETGPLDFAEQFIAPMGGPFTEPIMRDIIGRKKDFGKNGVRIKKTADKAIFGALNSVFKPLGTDAEETSNTLWQEEDEPFMRMDPTAYKIWSTVLLPIRVTANRFVEPVVEVMDKENPAQATAWIFTQLTGLGKAAPFSPEDVLAYDQREIEQAVKEEIERLEGGRREIGFEEAVRVRTPEEIEDVKVYSEERRQRIRGQRKGRKGKKSLEDIERELGFKFK